MQLPAAERIVMAIQGPGPTIRQELRKAAEGIRAEVERISEGQRYTTRLLTEQRDAAHHTLPAGSNH